MPWSSLKDKLQHHKWFISPNTVGLKLQTSYTVSFEIIATPRYQLFFTTIPHQKKSQHRKPPCPPQSNMQQAQCLKRGTRAGKRRGLVLVLRLIDFLKQCKIVFKPVTKPLRRIKNKTIKSWISLNIFLATIRRYLNGSPPWHKRRLHVYFSIPNRIDQDHLIIHERGCYFSVCTFEFLALS